MKVSLLTNKNTLYLYFVSFSDTPTIILSLSHNLALTKSEIIMFPDPQILALIGALDITERYLYLIVGSFLITMGTLGCLINLIIFIRRNLRHNPCSIYFIAFNAFNLCYIYVSLVGLTLEIVYHINPSATSTVVCRLRLYFSILLNWSNPFFLILASIDRIMITSHNIHTRQKSTRRLAYLSTIVGTLFWAIFHSHALIFSNIVEIAPNVIICYHQPGIYLTFMSYYSMTKEISALVLLIICALWTVKNVRSVRPVRVVPDIQPNHRVGRNGRTKNRSKDCQLIQMLLMDIVIYALFSFMMAIFLVYQEITQHQIKGVVRIRIEVFIRNVCFLSIAVPFCSSCYTNMIASRTFRKEVKKLLARSRLFCVV